MLYRSRPFGKSLRAPSTENGGGRGPRQPPTTAAQRVPVKEELQNRVALGGYGCLSACSSSGGVGVQYYY